MLAEPYNKIFSGVDLMAAKEELADNYHLFGEFNARKEAGPIHADMTDIWLRYGDIKEMVETGDYSKIADEHDSIWLKDLPACKKICHQVMSLVDGERLGGVLITKLPVGGTIKPHTDSGWHAEYYDKYFIPIQNNKGAVFGFESGVIDPEEGDVWAFDNSQLHWVENKSDKERIAMIVCIKQSKLDKGGHYAN
jgi:hypothetical protein